MKAHLQAAGLLLRQGTIVDATIIAAPSSTKNSTGERDPEMHQTKKGNQWYFGMKAHVGVDAESSLVHSVIGTAANVADVTKAHELLHGREAVAFGDAGYIGVEQRPEGHVAGDARKAVEPGNPHARAARWLHSRATAQAAPLRVKEEGRGLLPADVALNPKVSDAPGERTAFHASPVAVTVVPDWVTFADQPWVTDCPAVYDQRRVHGFSAAAPVLATVTVPVNPFAQSLLE